MCSQMHNCQTPKQDKHRFIDRKGYQFAVSTEYQFGANMTTMRVIESYDVIQADSSTYIYGTITAAGSKAVTTKAAA